MVIARQGTFSGRALRCVALHMRFDPSALLVFFSRVGYGSCSQSTAGAEMQGGGRFLQ